MARQAQGVLPDAVIRDARAEAALVFVDLTDNLDLAALAQWLQEAGRLVDRLSAKRDGRRYASAALGLGRKFFARRPEWAGLTPDAITRPTAMPIPAEDHDAMFYVMTTSEAVLAEFLTGLAATRPTLAAISIERGFQRRDRRELFGQRDGLRNPPPADRSRIAFVDVTDSPEEPAWTDKGSYLAYLKIRQNLDAWTPIDDNTREAVIGRRTKDGSRLDLPAGSDPRTEGPFTDPNVPPANSHVRKVGPRSAQHDAVAIFRRGVPYLTVNADGTLDAGLQFVSFQAHVDAFDVILNNWMLNANFPQPQAGQDALVARDLMTFLRAGLYFVPPHDARHPAAGLFDPPAPAKPLRRTTGRLRIRKRVVDAAGNPQPAERGGVTFQLLDVSGTPLGGPFTTDSAGRATSPEVPLNVPLTLREVTAPSHLQPQADQQVKLEHPNTVLEVRNTLAGPGPGYGG